MKDNNLAKYLNILVAVIALVGAILFIRVFMADGDALENDATVQNSVVSPIVSFSTILLYIAVGVTIVLSIWSVIKNPKALKNLIIGLGSLIVVLVICYATADSSAVVDMQGAVIEGGEAGTAINKWVGTGITFSIVLGGIAGIFFVWDLVKGLIKS